MSLPPPSTHQLFSLHRSISLIIPPLWVILQSGSHGGSRPWGARALHFIIRGSDNLAVWILVHLLGMELALAAAGLCLAWRWSDKRALRILCAVAVPLFFTLSVSVAVRFRFAIGSLSLPPILGLVAIVWLAWINLIYVERSRRLTPLTAADQPPGAAIRLIRNLSLAAGLLTLLAGVGSSVLVLSRWFDDQNTFHPTPLEFLTAFMLLGLVSGAILIALALYGLIVGALGLDPIHRSLARLRSAALWLQIAMSLRLAVIAASLSVSSSFSPFGPHFYLDRMIVAGSGLIMVRLLLGLILPVLFCWLVLLALRGRDHRQAASLFAPLAIIILIGEILSAGLTVGLAGISF